MILLYNRVQEDVAHKKPIFSFDDLAAPDLMPSEDENL
jgi:hypothetical protein